jgi:hypothetical protein
MKFLPIKEFPLLYHVIELELYSIPVQVQTRQLRVQWTVEMVEDLKNMRLAGELNHPDNLEAGLIYAPYVMAYNPTVLINGEERPDPMNIRISNDNMPQGITYQIVPINSDTGLTFFSVMQMPLSFDAAYQDIMEKAKKLWQDTGLDKQYYLIPEKAEHQITDNDIANLNPRQYEIFEAEL